MSEETTKPPEPEFDPINLRLASSYLDDKDMHPGRSSTIRKVIKARRIAKGKRGLYVPKPKQPTPSFAQTQQFHEDYTKRAEAAIQRLAQIFRPRKIP